ncbi:MAG: hypothetical protein ACRDVM_08810, partial [Acidimicrobiia bacterium]
INPVHYRHLRLVGSTGSTLSDYHEAAELARSGEVDLARLPVAVLGLPEADEALRRGPGPKQLKVLVDVTQGGHR